MKMMLIGVQTDRDDPGGLAGLEAVRRTQRKGPRSRDLGTCQ